MKGPCPKCGCDLEFTGEVFIHDFVTPERDPEHKTRINIALTCCDCETEFRAIVALDDFVEVGAAV